MERISKIAIDVQHIGKSAHSRSIGAKFEDNLEAKITMDYATKLYWRLYDIDLHPVLLTYGSYISRHIWMCNYEFDLYLACHVNAGGGDYSLVMIKENPRQDVLHFARDMSASFHRILGTSKPSHWTIGEKDRGFMCIERVRCPAFILEPFFIDDPKFVDISGIPSKVALAIEHVILAHNESLTPAPDPVPDPDPDPMP